MAQKTKPRILHAETVARSRLFCIEQLDLQFSNGTQVQYERLKGSGGGAVLVVPMLDRRIMLLIREYAAGVHRYELAFPKGRIEAGEDMLEAANRELMEEIGYGARQLEHLTSMTLAPGYFSHTTHVILAGDLYEQRIPGDEPETIEVVPWNIDDVERLMVWDDFTEARSIAALYMTRERMRSG
jgi:ADP-ribose diphosphatase